MNKYIFLYMIFKLFILINFAFGEDCSFNKWKYYNTKELKDCLKHQILYEDEKNKTLDAVRILLESSSHYNSMHNGQNIMWKYSYNVSEEINSIKKKNYSDVYTFYWDIQKAVSRMKEMNTHFTSPCTDSFYYDFPFRFSFESKVLDNGSIVNSFRCIESSMGNIYHHYIEDGNADLVGKIITHLTLDDVDDIPNESPENTIARWANTYINFKSESSRFAFSMRETFWHRSASFFEPPESIIISYKDGNEGEIKKVTVPFYGCTTKNFNVPDSCSLSSSKYLNSSSHSHSFKQKYINNSIPSKTYKEKNNSLRYFSSNTDYDILMSNEYLECIYFKTKKMGYIRLFTLQYNNIQLAESFVSGLYGAFEMIASRSTDKIIIDVRETNGDSPVMAQILIKMMFPQTNNWNFVIEVPMTNGAMKEIEKLNKDDYVVYSKLSENERFCNSLDEESQKRSERFSYSIYNYNSSVKYTLNTDSLYKHLNRRGNKKTKAFLSRNQQNIIIVTDGLCSGACSIFVHVIKNNNLAKVVFLKVPLNNKDNEFCLDGMNSGIKVVSTDNVVFPRESTFMSVEASYISSLIKNGRENFDLSYPESVRPDFVLPFLPEAESSQCHSVDVSVALSVAPFFNSSSSKNELKRKKSSSLLGRIHSYLHFNHLSSSDSVTLNNKESNYKDVHKLYKHRFNTDRGIYNNTASVLSGNKKGIRLNSKNKYIQAHDDDPSLCKFEVDKIYDLDKIENCMRTMPEYTKEERESIVNKVLAFLSLDPARDVMVKPPYHLEDYTYDVKKSLEELALKDSFNSSYDFEREVANIVEKINFANTYYFMPCSDIFAYVLPFILQEKLNTSSETYDSYFTCTDNFFGSATEQYLKLEDSVDLRNKIITHVTSPEISDVRNETSYATIRRWTESCLPKGVSFLNERTKNYFFSYRPFTYFEKPKDGYVTLKYKDKSSDFNEKTINLPFYSISTVAIDKLNDYCPLRSLRSKLKSINSSSFKTTSSDLNYSKEEDSKIDNKTISELAKRLLLHLSKDNGEKQNERLKKTTSFLNFERINNISKKFDNLKVKSFLSSKLQKNKDTIDVEFELTVNGTYIKTYNVKDWNLTVVSISDFYTLNIEEEASWMADLVTSVKKGKDAGLGQLIIIVNCDQPSPTLITFFSRFLFYYDFPYTQVYRSVSNNISSSIINSMAIKNKMHFINPSTLEIYHKIEEVPGYTNSYPEDIDEDRVRDWKGPFSLSSSHLLESFWNEIPEDIRKKRLYTPHDIMIITNGNGEGDFGWLINSLQEKKLAKTVNINKDITKVSSYYLALTSDTSVLASDVIDRYLPEEDSLLFPRYTADIMFSLKRSYSYLPEKSNELMDLVEHRADAVLPFPFLPMFSFSNDEDYLKSFINEIRVCFEISFNWEVKEAECDLEEEKKEHGIYGYPARFDFSGFDETKCVFSRCENGYYLNKDGICEAIPSLGNDKCIFSSLNAYSLNEVEDCLKTMPLGDEVNQTISMIKAMWEFMPFRDTLLNPPSGYESLKADLLSKIDEIGNGTYANGYEFQKSLSSFINQAGIKSLNYIPSCLSSFTSVFPYEFEIEDEKSDNQSKLRLKLKKTDVSIVYEKFVEEYSKYLENSTVLHITLPAEELSDVPDEDPIDTIKRWGKKFLPHLESEGTLFSHALFNFAYRMSALSPFPVGNVIMSLLVDDNNVTEEIPFYFMAPDAYSLDDICPLKNSSVESAQFIIPKNKQSNSRDFIRKTHSSLEGRIFAELERRLGKSLIEEEENENDDGIKYINNDSNHNFSQRLLISPDINAHHFKNFKHIIPLSSSYHKTNQENDYPDYVEVLPHSLFPGYFISEWNISYLSLKRNSDSDGIYNIFETLSAIRKYNPEKFIIDFRSIEFPDSKTFNALFALLFPDVFFRYNERDVVATNLSLSLLGMFVDNRRCVPTETDNLNIVSYNNISRVNRTEGVETQRKREWFSKASWNMDRMLDQYLNIFTPEQRKNRWFSQQNLIIITGPYLNSDASSFVSHVKEKHLAKIVYVGVDPSENNEETDHTQEFSLSPSGNELLVSGVLLSFLNPDFSFPRENQDLIMPFTESYGFNWETRNNPTSWNVLHPDIFVPSIQYKPYQMTVPDLEVIDNVRVYFDQCLSWEINEDTCTPAESNIVEHGVYGHPCGDDHHFNNSSCILRGCENGYYLDSNKQCKLIPKVEPLPLCNLKADEVVGYKEIESCLKTLPCGKDTDTENVITTILNYFESYVYRDTILSPPQPFTDSVDIIKELNTVANNTYENGYDFHYDIVSAINKLNDGHTQYHFPCSDYLLYALPYAFTFTSENGIITVSMVPSPLKLVYLHHMSISKGAASMSVVTHLKLDDLEDIEDERPEKTIERWAYQNVHICRTDAARLNYAIGEHFYLRPASMYRPKGDIYITGRIAKESEEVTVKVPWYGIATTDFDGLDSVCPVRSSENQRKSNLIETKENQDLEEVRNIYMENKNNPIYERIYKEGFSNITFVRMIQKELKESNENQKIQFSQITKHFEFQKKSKDFVKSFIQRDSLNNDLIKITQGSLIEGYVSSVHNLLYLYISSFNPSTEAELYQWLADIIVSLDYYKKNSLNRIILDLRSNEGGSVDLSTILLLLMFPNEHPSMQFMESVDTNLSKTELKKFGYIFADPESHSVIADPTKMETYEKTEGSVRGTRRTRVWFGKFGISPEILMRTIRLFLPEELKSTYIHPSNVVAVTDGECGSACSVFLKHLKEKNLVKVVGIGGVIGDSDVSYDISSYAAGAVYDSDSLEDICFEGKPEPFSRETTHLSFPFLNGKSFNWETIEEDLEFKLVKPDNIIDLYPSVDDKNPSYFEKIIDKVYEEFGKCYSWEIEEADCHPDEGESKEHGIYGHPAKDDGSGFDDSKCVFARCMDGYYLDSLGKCKEIPHLNIPTCSFSSMLPVPWKDVETCLKTLPYDKKSEETKSTIPTILEYLKGYAYRDTMLNPPHPFEDSSIDIISELENIDNSSYLNGYDFHESISTTISKLRDALTLYHFPCSDNFLYILPFAFQVNTINSESVPPVFEVTAISNPLCKLSNILSMYSITDLRGKIITHLKLDDLEDVNDEKPEATIARWAEKYLPLSRSPPSQLNFALSMYFHIRPLSFIHRPKGDITVSYKDSESEEEKSTSLPFFGISLEDMKSLDDICPLKQSTFNYRRINERYLNDDDGSINLDILSEGKMKIIHNMSSFESSSDNRKKELLRSNSLKRLKQIKSSVEKYSDNSEIKKNNLLKSSNDKPNLEIIVNNSYIFGVVIPDWSMGYIHIQSFFPESGIEIAVKDFLSVLTSAKEKKCNNFVIDVRSNDGENSVLGSLFARFLSPKEFPSYFELEYPDSLSNKYNFAEKKIPGVHFTNPTSLKIYPRISSLPLRNRTEGTAENNRTRLWSSTYSENADELYNMYKKYLPEDQREKALFAPQNLLAITDGECGFACGTFLKGLRERKALKVVGLGSNLVNNSIPFDIASFTSGKSIDSRIIPETEEFSSSFKRETTALTWSSISVHSFDWENENKSLDFKIVEPDVVLPLYPQEDDFTTEGRLRVLEKVKPFFEKHFSWEIEEANCQPDEGENKEHGVYGHPAKGDGSGFDDSKCVFYHCEDGYYLDEIGKCVSIPVFDSSCDIQANTLVSAKDALKCLKSVPFDKSEDEGNKTISIILKYLESYAYRDTILNPPSPHEYQAFDIVTELETIKNNSYDNGLDFHEDIVSSFSKLRDPHTLYSFPCSGEIIFILPYRFDLITEKNENGNITYSLKAQSFPKSILTDKYVISSGVDLREKIITHLKLDDLDDIPGERPENTISRWAEKYVGLSRSPSARLNFALSREFYIRSLISYRCPKDDHITVSYKDSERGEEKTIDVSFFAFAADDIGDLNDYCPISNNTRSLVTDKMNFSSQNKTLNDQNKKTITFTESAKRVMRRVAPKNYIVSSVNNTRFNKYNSSKNVLFNHLVRNGNVFNLEDRLFPLFSKKRNKELNKFSSEIDNLQNFTNFDKTYLKNDVGLEKVAESIGMTGYILSDSSLGYLVFSSFDVETEDDYIVHTINALIKMKERNISKLIIDVRGNFGGLPSLGDYLIHLLFVNEFPISSELEYPQSSLSDQILKQLYDGYEKIIIDSETFDVTDLENLKVYSKKEGNESVTRERSWRGTFSFNSDNHLRRLLKNLPDNLKGKNLFNPHDVIVVTDGECSSACSQFLKHIKEKNLVKVVGLGGAIENNNLPFDISSSGGGAYADSDYCQSIKPVSGPEEFPRDSTRVSFTIHNSLSFNWDANRESLEFKIVQPDVVLPVYPLEDDDTDAGRLRIINEVKPFFEKYFSWEIKEADCEPDEGENKVHGVYGHPAKDDESGFDDSKCVFYHCEKGYYLDKNGICQIIPPTKSPNCPFNDNSVTDWTDVEDCLEQLPYDKHSEETKSTIPTILEYLKGYAYRDTMLNPPHPFEDSSIDIISELENIDNSSYLNGYDFHESISTTISKLKDPTTQYHFPCADNFVYVLPYRFIIATNISDDGNINFEVRAVNGALSDLTEYFVQETGIDLRKMIITHLKLDDLEDVEDEKPEITIARWAERYVTMARTPSARFNFALSTEFYVRYLNLYNRPKGDIEVRYKVSNDSEDHIINIPFFGYVIDGMLYLDDICPVRSVSNNVNYRSRKSTINSLKTTRLAIERNDPLHSFNKRIISIPKESKNTLNKSYISNSYLRNIRRSSFKSRKSNDEMDAFEIKSWDMAYLHIMKFTPEVSYKFFCADIVSFFRKVKNDRISYFVLDLRNSLNGNEKLAAFVFHALFPNRFPVYSGKEVIDTNTSKYYCKNNTDSIKTDPLYLFKINDLIEEKFTERTEGTPQINRTRLWSKRFADNYDSLFQTYWNQLKDEFGDKELFDPRHILVITDGTCGSACSQFIKQLREQKTIRIVGLGGSLIHSDIPYDIASYTGVDIVSSSQFEKNVSRFTFPNPFYRTGTSLSWTIGNSYSYIPGEEFHSREFEILSPDVVLPFYPQHDDFTPRGILRLLEEVKPFFEKRFSWEVEEANCQPDEGENKEHGVYGHPAKGDGSGFDDSKCVFYHCEDGYYLNKDEICIRIPEVHEPICRFSKNEIVSYERIESCLKTLPYDKESEETKSTIPTILEYLKGYAYRDTMLNPPHPFEDSSIDIISELENIDNSSYLNGYDFHESISTTISKLRDAQLIYSYPCSDLFVYVLPYRFVIDRKITNGKNDIIVRAKEHPFENVTKHFLQEKGVDLTGKIITHIKLDDLEDISNEKPEVTIARWAERYVGLYRTPSARLNFALSRLFHTRSLKIIHRPKGNITLTYKEEDGNETNNIDIPFYGYVFEEIDELDDYCPLKKRKIRGTDNNRLYNLDKRIYPNVLDSFIKEKRKARESFANNDVKQEQGFTLIVNNSYLAGYISKSLKMGILRLNSFFAPTDNEKIKWRESVIKVVSEVLEHNYTRFILDLRGNDGGAESLGSFLLHLIDPYVFPLNGELHFPSSSLNKDYYKSLLNNNTKFRVADHYSLEDIPDLFEKPLFNVTEGKEEGVRRTREWTSTFSFNEDNQYESQLSSLPEKYRNKRLFSPQQLVAITDGRCISACSTFIKHLRESKMAKIIGVGNAFYNNNIPFDIGSSSSGNIMSSENLNVSINNEGLVKPFARSGTSFTYPVTDMLSFEELTKNDSLEFKVLEPDVILDYYPQLDEGEQMELESMVNEVLPSFDHCYQWEIQEASCYPDGYNNSGRELFGHPCSEKEGIFNESSCVFFKCIDGYYLYNGTCILMPNFNDPSPTPTDTPTPSSEPNKGGLKTEIIIVIVLLSTFVAVISLSIVFICSRKKRKKKYDTLSDNLLDDDELDYEKRNYDLGRKKLEMTNTDNGNVLINY